MVHCDRGIRKGDMLFLQKSYNFTSKIQGSQFFYIPCLDTSQLHIPFKTYVPAVSNYTKYNVTISILVYDLTRFQMFFGFTQPELLKEVNPYMAQIYSDDMIDFVKQILFTNNFYLVLFYFILSTLQTFMQIFAFKSQV